MKKIVLFSLAAATAIASHIAMAGNTSAPHDQEPGSGVTTRSMGAWVRPGFASPTGSQVLKKAGAASSTSCTDPAGYTPVTWSTFDRWGSFPIARPADVVGEVRYCVSLRLANSHAFDVKYNVIGK